MERENRNFDSWRVSQDRFQGYVKAKLEGIEYQMIDMKKCHSECRVEMLEKTQNNAKQITDMKIKTLSLGAVLGGIGGFIGGLFRGFL